MQISATFHFRDEPETMAKTESARDIADFLLPGVGDLVWHCDGAGVLSMGRVARSVTSYGSPESGGVAGNIATAFLLERLPVR